MKINRSLLVTLAFAVPAIAYCDQYSTAILNNSPFSYYRLNESSGTSAVDLGSAGITGTYVHSPTLGVPGALQSNTSATGVAFNRTASQYMQLTNLGNEGTTMKLGFTIEFWLKDTDTTNYQVIMGTANNATQTDFVNDLNYSGNTNMLRLYFRGDDGNRLETQFLSTTSGNTNIFDNNWHLITETYDPTISTLANKIKFYVDGTLQTTTPLGTGNPTSGNFEFPLTVGALNDRGSIGNYLNGSLDEVAIYNTALPQGTISSHYAASVPEPVAALQIAAGVVALLGLQRARRPKTRSRKA